MSRALSVTLRVLFPDLLTFAFFTYTPNLQSRGIVPAASAETCSGLTPHGCVAAQSKKLPEPRGPAGPRAHARENTWRQRSRARELQRT